MKYAIIIALFTSVTCHSQEIDTVLDFEFYFPDEVENWYKENYNKNTKSKVWILSNLYDKPDRSSTKVGELVTYFEPAINNCILQFRTIDGSVIKEIKQIGDWGYGIHLNITGWENGFAQLPYSFLSDTAWIPAGDEPNSLNGHATTFVDQIVSLPSTAVKVYPNGQSQKLQRGNYVIEKIYQGTFIIRKEVPTDMPCGENVEWSNLDKLTRYQLRIINLLGDDGEISIKVAYPKGC